VHKNLARLTFDKAFDLGSIWTPDSKRIIFYTGRTGNAGGICWKAADGTGKDELLSSPPNLALLPYSLSRDGKNIAVVETDMSSKWDIGIIAMEGDHPLKHLMQESYAEVQPQVSPDGRWIAYSSNESSGSIIGQVYVRPFPEVDKGKWQVSTSGGSSPLWSPDGRELFYLSEDNSVMSVAVETKTAFSHGTPKLLFKSNYAGAGATSGIPWDIHPDGKRFLMMKSLEATSSTGPAPHPKITVVVNWFEELKQRVPVK
jgi:Tol biopolymer transport system component